MLKWKKVAVQKGINDEQTITYRAEGADCEIESRRRAIPHTQRGGYWLHTTYYLVRKDGTEKTFWRMKDAQKAAEEGRG